MTQFFAILKDSFYEAVDGFVIYVMLGIATLIILVVGSMSYTPAEPPDAFQKIVTSREFSRVIPDRGRSRAISMVTTRDVQFSVADVQAQGSGYQLRLTATGRSNDGTTIDEKAPREDLSKGDSFRKAVAIWAKQPKTIKATEVMEKAGKGNTAAKGNGGFGDVEISLDNDATPEEQRAVTDADMEAFLQNQFALHAGMDVTVTRVKSAAAEPTYVFDVTTTGGSSVRGWPHTTKIFFGAVTITDDTSLGRVLYIIEDQIINGLGGAVALLIGLIITSFFIPNMLRKGSVDLIISKPIGRSQLLIYKYIGGLTFVFLVTTFTVGGIWLAIAVRSGYWDPRFLAVIPILTFTFAIVYAMSTVVAVFTRSAIAAMIVSIGFMLFLYIVGQVKTLFDVFRIQRAERMPEWAYTLVDTLNNVLPRYKDLDKLTSKMIAEGTLTPGEFQTSQMGLMQLPSWTGTFGVSLIFIGLMLAIACWRFNRRDY
jgi:ABC-type transport system involved in multi-copper enzyme maturation permease subunit